MSNEEFDITSTSNICYFLFLVCKAVVDEIENEVDKIDPHKKIDVGSFRLDGNGNVRQNMVTLYFKPCCLTILFSVVLSEAQLKPLF